MTTISNETNLISNEMSFETTHLGDAASVLQLGTEGAPRPDHATSLRAALAAESPDESQLFSALEATESTRKDWEDTVYRKSNEKLYELLGDCLAYLQACSGVGRRTRTKALECFCTARHLTFTAATPLASKVVRAVFGDTDRRRISTYSLVVRVADAQGVEPSEMPAWITRHGGVQEIKLGGNTRDVSTTSRAKRAEIFIEKLGVLGTFTPSNPTETKATDSEGNTCVFIAARQDDGSYLVRAIVHSETALKSAFSSLYSERKEEIEEAKREVEAQEKLAA